MKFYIARDKDNSISLCTHKQVYDEFLDSWEEPKQSFDNKYGFYIYISEKLFPEVTFENSPQEVELKLVEKFNPIINKGKIDKSIIDRACEWLKNNIDLYTYVSLNTHYPEIKLTECFETAFKKAMEEGVK